MIFPGQYQSLSYAINYTPGCHVNAYPYTMHEHFECFYIRQGEVHMTIDGAAVTLGPGDLSFTSSFLFHRIEHSANARADILIFSPSVCAQVSQLFANRKPVRPYLRKSELPPILEQMMSSLPAVFRELPTGGEKPKHTYSYKLGQEECKTLGPYLSVLLLELVRVMPLVTLESANISSMQNILAYCSANYTQDISREAVAQACHVSTGIVSQIFSRMGTSFRDYINSLRIAKAYYLLISTQTPITEIIYECGYSNQGTFNRNFYTQFGMTPRQVRASSNEDAALP